MYYKIRFWSETNNHFSLFFFVAKRVKRFCNLSQITMTTSRRLADRKVARFQRNITKRSSEGTSKKGYAYPVGPIVLGFFVFVVVGSSLFQIIRIATSRGTA